LVPVQVPVRLIGNLFLDPSEVPVCGFRVFKIVKLDTGISTSKKSPNFLCNQGSIPVFYMKVGTLAGLPPVILRIFAYFLSVTVLGSVVGGDFSVRPGDFSPLLKENTVIKYNKRRFYIGFILSVKNWDIG